MDIKIAEELLDELFSSLETLETKSAATLQFLKDRGQVTDEQIAPYLEQAGNASNVRWRATRLRIMSLLSAATKNPEEPAKKPEASNEDKKQEDAPKQDPASEKSERSNGESSPEPATASTRAEAEPPGNRSAQQPVDQKKDRKEKEEDPQAPKAQSTPKAENTQNTKNKGAA